MNPGKRTQGRREFLWRMGAGFTGVAMSGLLQEDGFFGGRARAATALADAVANP